MAVPSGKENGVSVESPVTFEKMVSVTREKSGIIDPADTPEQQSLAVRADNLRLDFIKGQSGVTVEQVQTAIDEARSAGSKGIEVVQFVFNVNKEGILEYWPSGEA